MNYKEKYEEALERAKRMFSEKELNYLFPELAESEEERIRKELAEFLKNASEGHLDFSIPCKTFGKWLTWLEKQGESDETKAKRFLINKGYPIDANGVFPTYEEIFNIIKEGLEKQGDKTQGKTELVAVKEEKNKVEPKDYNTIDPHFGKPIDKVEPKFKVGDYV